ncbi:hypothetical protein CR513_02749, partial [Mucuna pruriens]
MKCKFDGTLESYQARLVSKRYTQTYTIDYEKTFAPITNMNTIRLLILAGTCNNLMLKMSSFMET